jgi:ATP-binding cassette, subfamily B, bacterial PglK
MIKQILNLLTFKLKLQLTFLVFLMFIKGLMELVSISSIPFLIMYLLNPDKVVNFLNENNFNYLSEIVIAFNLTNILIVVVLIFFIKNFLFFLINIYEENFHFKINLKFRSDLLKHYLMLNYLDLIKNNISIIIRNISIEANHFSSAITNIVKITHDSIMIFIFLIFLTYVSSIEFILIFISFSVFSILIFLFLKKKLKFYGELSVDSRGLYLKNITDTFSLVKDILLNHLEYYFFNLFNKNLKKAEKIDFFSKVVFSSTKLFFETFAVLLLCLLIYLNLESNNDKEELLAYLSVVSIVIIRMLPLFNTVLSEANKLQFRFGSVKAVYQILNNKSKISKDNFFNTEKIKQNDLLKYSNKLVVKNLNSTILNKEILNNINLEIIKGSKIALLGVSGSGKSTFLNHLCQLYGNSMNIIFSDGMDISLRKREWQNLVSYMPQENNLINGSIIENIALGVEKNKINYENLKHAIKLSCCDEFLDKLTDKENTFLGKDGFKLSGGQVQRICIARSLYKDFEILLMDEPTSSLDKNLELNILDNIFQNYKNKTILISLHKLELINKFDYIIVFDQKKLYSFTKVVDIDSDVKLLSFLENLKKNENK